MNTQEHYKEKFSIQLDELGAEIDKLKAQASRGKVELRAKLDDYIDDLDEKRKHVGEKLASMKDSGDQAVDDVQRGLKDAWDRLEIAQRAAKARFH